MKRILKLFPVAMAVFALASCSNDDLLGEKGYTTSEKGDLIVEVEPFDNTTRALRDADGLSLTFENGDAMNVYDDELYKYDIYKFNNDAFYLDGTKILQTPKYALFPGENVVRGYFDRSPEVMKTVAEFKIPRVITYDSKSEKKVGDKVLYSANLPMFGLASFNGNKVYVSKLRHVCSVLKLDLENVKFNTTWLKLSTTDGKTMISGTFKAVLDASSEDARKKVALVDGGDDLKTYEDMYIDLRNIPNRTGVLYIPIKPGLVANKVGLSLQYTDNDMDETAAIAYGGWVDTGLMFPKEVFGVNQLKEASWKFQLTDMTPNKVSELLEAYKGSEEDIEFELADVFTIGTEVDYGTTIAIPQLNNGVNVTLSLGENFDEWDNGTTGTAGALVIADADPTKPFTGTFTLNIGDILDGTLTTEDAGDLTINLPKATVQLVGDYTNTDILSGTAGLTITAAKKVILGDATNAPSADDLKVGDNYTTIINPTNGWTLTPDVAEVEIAKYTTFTGDIEEDPDGDDELDLPIDFVLTVNGAMTGDIDLEHVFGSELHVTSDFGYFDTTNYAAGKAEKTAITGDVTLGGDAWIALGSEGEAISGTLVMTGARSDINLVQGYVNEIAVDVANNGDWENYRYVNLNLNADNEGNAAFLTLTEYEEGALANSGGFFNITESNWNGKVIDNVDYNSGNNYYDKFVTFTELDRETKTIKAAVNNTIFTASQFASFNGIGSAALLSNDLDMNNKPWTGYAVKTTFDGQEYTISNLALKAGAGLFASTTGAFTIENLTIDGVTVPSATEGSNVGGLLATTANDVTANKLTITNIAIDNGGTKALSNVGGLIGSLTAGTVTLTDVYVDGSIKGYSALGGLIGNVIGGSISATASKYSAVVAVTNNYKIGTELDMPLAMIGGFVGTTAVNLVFTAPKAQPTAPVHTYPAFEKMSDINALSGNLVSYTAEQNFVGFSGQKAKGAAKAAPVNVKVDKTTYYVSPTSKDKTVAEWKADGTTAGFGNNEACMYTVK